MSSDRTTRATFVMNKSSRDLLKRLALRYEVSQSEIMNSAPFLFLVMAERSLARRKSQMATTRLLVEQASRSLASLPHHLVLGDVEDRISLAVQLEEASIRKHQVHGPTAADIDELMARGFLPTHDPLQETIVAALADVGAKAAAARYKAMLSDDEEDSFLDEEEEAERAAVVEKLLGDFNFDDLLGEGTSSTRDVSTRVHYGPNSWRGVIEGEDLFAKSGAEALCKALQILVRKDPLRLTSIASVKGSVRPLISSDLATLYPGRPDLAEHSREFVPGWFVGTNYSKKDVLRLVRAATEACSLVWGVDAYVHT